MRGPSRKELLRLEELNAKGSPRLTPLLPKGAADFYQRRPRGEPPPPPRCDRPGPCVAGPMWRSCQRACAPCDRAVVSSVSQSRENRSIRLDRRHQCLDPASSTERHLNAIHSVSGWPSSRRRRTFRSDQVAGRAPVCKEYDVRDGCKPKTNGEAERWSVFAAALARVLGLGLGLALYH